jgi:hypothetical protein
MLIANGTPTTLGAASLSAVSVVLTSVNVGNCLGLLPFPPATLATTRRLWCRFTRVVKPSLESLNEGIFHRLGDTSGVIPGQIPLSVEEAKDVVAEVFAKVNDSIVVDDCVPFLSVVSAKTERYKSV